MHRIRAKAKKNKKFPPPGKSRGNEDSKRSSDDYVKEDSIDIGGIKKNKRKEEIDIMGKDTIPIKSNKMRQGSMASDEDGLVSKRNNNKMNASVLS